MNKPYFTVVKGEGFLIFVRDFYGPESSEKVEMFLASSEGNQYVAETARGEILIRSPFEVLSRSRVTFKALKPLPVKL
ncbi:MAG: hypothetical protein ABI430_05165 [Candidatus Taylorbacteria bacterium]